MNRKIVAASVFFSILMLGVMTYSITVSGYGFKRLESFKSLPEDKQTLIIETMESVHAKNSGVREEILAAKQALMEVLTAPEFDEKAFQANVDKMNELHDQMFLSITSAIKDVAAQFTQEERQVLVDLLPKGNAKHGKHDGKRGCGHNNK